MPLLESGYSHTFIIYKPTAINRYSGRRKVLFCLGDKAHLGARTCICYLELHATFINEMHRASIGEVNIGVANLTLANIIEVLPAILKKQAKLDFLGLTFDDSVRRRAYKALGCMYFVIILMMNRCI